MELVDSHCHIDFPPLGDDVDALLRAAREQDIRHLLCVSVNQRDFPRVLSLAATKPGVFASVGVHPNEGDEDEVSVEFLIEQSHHPRVIAIGETGLDYFRSAGDLTWQRDRFARHIEAARAASLPLIIHTRDAAEDTLAMMREHGADEAGGVMHCFAENWDVARRALDLGFYISFSGIVTFKSARVLQDVARKVPADRILVETDAPYLAPVPHRGKTNQPAFVRHTAEFVAALRGETLERLAEITTENFFRLFPKAVPDTR
jgi:TatD DNase family protein